jgi:PAS domain S-box-containing protein
LPPSGDASWTRSRLRALTNLRGVPYFICPNCRRRTVDHDGLEDLTNERVGCSACGFGFLFELMDDYYPAPGTGFVVCDQDGRILAAGRGVFELTGFHERELLGRALSETLGLETHGEQHPAGLALEWGVRRLGQKVAIRTRTGSAKDIKADFFPAYDEDGGLLVALIPRSE